ncbi:hypothetical protein K439DRAFT_1613879 [Ramaria rubella]|nr:hypothetical protein K439DRAFT_1613879 [Ramaria rubella]
MPTVQWQCWLLTIVPQTLLSEWESLGPTPLSHFTEERAVLSRLLPFGILASTPISSTAVWMRLSNIPPESLLRWIYAGPQQLAFQCIGRSPFAFALSHPPAACNVGPGKIHRYNLKQNSHAAFSTVPSTVATMLRHHVIYGMRLFSLYLLLMLSTEILWTISPFPPTHYLPQFLFNLFTPVLRFWDYNC